MHAVLWEMDQWLRKKIKHAPDTMSVDTYNALELCRGQLHEFMDGNDINLEE
tara:strand:+ start:122 stop:277 length:156 start_codon:yes stop_codon:yes gene_type:complete